SVTPSGDNFAAGPQSAALSLQLQNNANGTGTTGNKSYSVTVHNTAPDSGGAGQGSADPDDTINVAAKVMNPSQATFVSSGTNALSLNMGSFSASTGIHNVSQAIYNALQALETSEFTAKLDFDTVSPGTGDTSILHTNLTNNAFT